MRAMIVSAVLLWLATGASVQAAQIYKWVDAQGVTHYDATPPAGAPAEQVDLQASPPPSSGSSAPRNTEPDPAAHQRAIDAKVKKQAAVEEKKRQANCEIIRTNLAKLKTYSRIREPVEDGYKRLTQEERQARIDETEKMIAEYCN